MSRCPHASARHAEGASLVSHRKCPLEGNLLGVGGEEKSASLCRPSSERGAPKGMRLKGKKGGSEEGAERGGGKIM